MWMRKKLKTKIQLNNKKWSKKIFANKLNSKTTTKKA